MDIDPDLKKQFHAALTIDGTTFKDWALARIHDYLENRNQPNLPGLASSRQDSFDDTPDRIAPDRLAAEPPAPDHSQKNPDTR